MNSSGHLTEQPSISWLDSMLRSRAKVQLSISELTEVVGHVTDIPIEKLTGPSQKPAICLGRQLISYYGHRFYGYTFRAMGEHLGGRHYSSMINGIKTLKNLLDAKDPAAVAGFQNVGLYLSKVEARVLLDKAQGMA